MYSFNLENSVPTGGLACLIAKATVDESNKWHRRLGHVNFKNLNKLVKGNLVSGLPSKIFQNDHTCVACQKEKQHKASSVTEGRQSKETEELNVTHDTEVLEKGGSNEEPVNAAGNIGVGTATPMTPPCTKNVFEDEDIFLADALEMLSDKAKLKGVEIKEKKDAEKPTRSIFTLKPLPKINPKDKGKGVLKEEPEPVKVKSKDQGEAQIERDAEIALKVQAELDEEAKLERQRQEQASLNYIANLYDEV
ncbi:putative ribonuclease H-like domain-containing protein [Tanacetum coccineum]